MDIENSDVAILTQALQVRKYSKGKMMILVLNLSKIKLKNRKKMKTTIKMEQCQKLNLLKDNVINL